MHDRSRASAGTRSIAAAGMRVSKHQQVEAPAAIPHAFGPPQIGQVSWRIGVDTRRVYSTERI